jgi:LCP family protein required for cell wall assembly
MKRIQLLNTRPNSKAIRLGLLVALILIIILMFAGTYLVANTLAGGSSGFASFMPIDIFGQDNKAIENTSPFSVPESNLPEWEAIPIVALTPWDGTGRVTVLVMGLDYRDWSAGDGPSRTDTMMLLTMNPLDNTAGMLSVPRDLWVSIPGFENGRINTAYFLGESYQTPGGGPGLAVKTVEQLLGVSINYYAQVDFSAFIRFIDELGGVKIDVPGRIRIDPIVGNPKYLDPGRQTLPGELALGYARARNTEGGDLDRALRQQQVIFGIRDRLLKPESLTDLIAKAPSLYAEIASGVQTNMTLDEVVKLAVLAQKVQDADIARGAISASEVLFAQSPDEQSILVPLPEKIRELRDNVFLGSTGTLGPLLPGTPQERMTAEGAKITLLNSSQAEGLASQTGAYLQDLGANIVEVSNGELTNNTRIVDYTGNPHTVKYLSEIFGLLPGNYELNYDPISPVDVVVFLGVDWSTQEIPQTSDEITTYQDDTFGFALDYPADWTKFDVLQGDRGSIFAIASWEGSAKNMDSTPPGETRMDIGVLQWEPLDLEAYVLQRKTAWEASEITILSEEKRQLQDGLPVVEFRLAGRDGDEVYFLAALIGDRFITLSGTRDFEIMSRIGDSLCIVN